MTIWAGPPHPGRRRRRSQAQRRSEAEEKILAAAVALIAEQGGVATSLAQIGERAGFSRGIVNHHFGTRHALFERIVEDARDELVESLTVDTTRDGLGTVVALVDDYLRLVSRPDSIHRAFVILWAEAAGSGGELKASFVTSDRRVRAAVRTLVQSGMADGSIRSDLDPSAVAGALVGQLRALGLQMTLDPAASRLVATRRALRGMLRAGLAAPTPTETRTAPTAERPTATETRTASAAERPTAKETS